MRLVLTCVTGMRNRGVEAFAVTSAVELLRRRPDARVAIMTQTPDYDQLRLPEGVRAVDVKPVERTMMSRLRQSLSHVPGLTLPRVAGWDEAVRTISGAKLLIATGGDLFTSGYGQVELQLTSLRLALDRDVPIAFSAQSIGPFKEEREAEAFVRVARRARLVTVRERISLEYVTKTLGLPARQVQLVADPAFLLPAAPEGDAMLAYYGITRDRPIVVLAPSQGISVWGEADSKRHREALQAVVSEALDTLGAQVLIVPHVDDIYADAMDRLLATDLLRAVAFDPRVRIASCEHTAAEFKALIGAADLVVAERMHASIAGLSMGVCTLSVGYSNKARGIVEGVLGDGAAAEGWVIPVNRFCDASEAQTCVRWAWERRAQAKARIRDALPDVRRLAAANFNALVELVA